MSDHDRFDVGDIVGISLFAPSRAQDERLVQRVAALAKELYAFCDLDAGGHNQIRQRLANSQRDKYACLTIPLRIYS